ncbi:MAG: hypothetical protein VYC34_00005, partial [Planctomycetota bacterium]|nr:hypothetical protein [Planctomycetota bacterium]
EIGGMPTACYSACWIFDQAFSIGGGAAMIGDELRVLAELPSNPFDHIESFTVRAAELRWLILTEATVERAAPCPADLDGDGVVGSADLGALLGAWGQPGPADFDASGGVGSEDLGVLLGSWGPCP